MSAAAAYLKHAALRRAARAYLSGPALEDALDVAESLHRAGHAVTLCYWSAEDDSPALVADRVRALVQAAGPRPAWCDVAIKVPALGFDRRTTDELGRCCRDHGLRLWFDSHDLATATPTLELAESASALGTDVGVALPARWRRTRADAVRAMQAGLSVRVIKGQWRDADADPEDVRAQYLELVECLAGARHVALATHDSLLLHEACHRLASRCGSFEIQLLYGLESRRILEFSGRHDVMTRFYVPFGHPSLIYSARSIWENRRTAARFMQDVVLTRYKHRVLQSGRSRRPGE